MKRRYTDKSAVEKYLVRSIDTSFDAQMDEWSEGITRHIEMVTNRRWIPETDTSSLPISEDIFYDGNGTSNLLVDEFTAISAISYGDLYGNNFVTAPNVIKYPKLTSEQTCFWKIVDPTWIPVGVQNIKVTGVLGYSTTLDKDIRFAATVMVAGIINSTQGIVGQKMEQIGSYRVVYYDDPTASDFARAQLILATRTRYFI